MCFPEIEMNGMKATNIVTDLKFNNFFLNEKLFLIWVEIKHFLSWVRVLHLLMFFLSQLFSIWAII